MIFNLNCVNRKLEYLILKMAGDLEKILISKPKMINITGFKTLSTKRNLFDSLTNMKDWIDGDRHLFPFLIID